VIQEKSVSGDARARAQLKRNVLQEKARVVAKIIKFYIPNSFRKKGKGISSPPHGKVIEFVLRREKSA